MGGAKTLGSVIAWIVRLYIAKLVLFSAYEIRLYAIKSYGLVIHEFDPWFNFRATQYLADNGWTNFFHWFDHRAWYPLGRPVGTTIYPGMQITSVAIFETLKRIGQPMSLNDVCCYVPAWFGAIATVCLGMLTWECSGSANAGLISAAIMAIIPAHIMRSVGGGYDNESVAMTAMILTFYLWNRAIRAPHSKLFAVLAALAYVYMVASWGGFIFVINMVALHAASLVPLGYYNDDIYWAYTIFYVIGTFGATHVPVVGWSPLKSLEQLSGAAVFIVYQTLQACEFQRKRAGVPFHSTAAYLIRMRTLGVVATAAAVFVATLFPSGYFGPLSSRVRGLLVKHTRTGNPLVDSVAEHQPANEQAYRTYLHHTYPLAPYGLGLAIFIPSANARFLIIWAAVVFFFANKMMRLILLTGPVAASLCGLVLGLLVDWSLDQFTDLFEAEKKAPAEIVKATDKKKAKEVEKEKPSEELLAPLYKPLYKAKKSWLELYNNSAIKIVRKFVAVAITVSLAYNGNKYWTEFWDYSHQMAEQLSSPSIMFHATLRDGSHVTVDDYRQAYWWLKENTPEDARVMAWWDYGYQISGIANRTTIADGNTWNHEHIATLGRCLTAPEDKAHKIVRHLADYVLVWTGGGGDDLAKSPHMARIGNSVYSDICPGDPTCAQFGFYQGGKPTPMMEASLLYKLHSNMVRPGVTVDPTKFKEVYRSQYGKVRIYQVLKVSAESKAWVADAANRICDAPGSWYCVGQYPPALKDLISRRKNFAQLEDFNSKAKRDNEYTREYMARMNGEKRAESTKEVKDAPKANPKAEPPKKANPKKKKAEVEESEEESAAPKIKRRSKKWAEGVEWANTEHTTMMFEVIQNNDVDALEQLLTSSPDAVHMRSADGRGPLWWANEFKRAEMIDMLTKFKVRDDLVDSDGNLPGQ